MVSTDYADRLAREVVSGLDIGKFVFGYCGRIRLQADSDHSARNYIVLNSSVGSHITGLDTSEDVTDSHSRNFTAVSVGVGSTQANTDPNARFRADNVDVGEFDALTTNIDDTA
ncbi:hypothetical protein [Halorubrum depositum]|uniref:hypothetical protein n=1 Tax=Halorubrum depositum TaxID=2583992 RepID=UPI001F4FE376|nr:hypothetical protein [Halorubrum depositum]